MCLIFFTQVRLNATKLKTGFHDWPNDLFIWYKETSWTSFYLCNLVLPFDEFLAQVHRWRSGWNVQGGTNQERHVWLHWIHQVLQIIQIVQNFIHQRFFLGFWSMEPMTRNKRIQMGMWCLIYMCNWWCKSLTAKTVRALRNCRIGCILHFVCSGVNTTCDQQ